MSTQVYRRESGLWVADGRSGGSGGPTTPPGPFWGMAYTSNGIPTPIETAAGRPVGVRRTYWYDNQGSASIASAAADVAAGRVPWVSYALTGSTWQGVAGGSLDSTWESIAAGLGALDGPVMVTVCHEPETKKNDSTNRLPVDFVSMQAHVYPIFQDYPNIKFGPIIITANYIDFPGAWGSLASFYPGDFPGDFFGFDLYNRYGTASNGAWHPFPPYYRKIAQFAASKGVDWACGEFGIGATGASYNRSITGGSPDGSSGGDITFLRDAYDSAISIGQEEGSTCLALSYFNSGLNSTSNITKNGIDPTPSSLIGHPAWMLNTQVINGTTYPSDGGSPSKLDVWLDVLADSPTWRSSW